MKATALSLFLCGTLCYSPATSLAEIFKYRDESGQLTFVDDKSKIPPQFLDAAVKINESPTAPAVENVYAEHNRPLQQVVAEQQEITRNPVDLKHHQTAVRILGNRVLVPAKVAMGNRVANLNLLLDTGATVTVLHRKSLVALDLPSGKRYNARVAGGGVVSSEKILFRHIDIGPFRESRPFAMVIDPQGPTLPFDGMLGMDFLRTHPYTIDYDKELITWSTDN